jgi:hypothetical protein
MEGEDAPTQITTAARVRRFIRALARGLVSDVKLTLRTREYFPTLRRLTKTVRRSWTTSDPQWWGKAFPDVEPSPEELERLAEAKRRREQVRAQLTGGRKAVYEGAVKARVAMRGLRLDNPGHEHSDLDGWLTNVLGLDDWYGDRVEGVRITVELIGDRVPTENTPSSSD